MEMSGQLHAPAALLPGKSPWYQWIGGSWVGPRAGLDAVVKQKNSQQMQGLEPSIIILELTI
jgi:hypothetical protein